MRNLDFSSWQNLLSTLVALALVTLIGVGIRLVAMSTIQQRRERANRQINERLRVLIAAYKTLGGSFTGNLSVDPTHLRDLLRRSPGTGEASGKIAALAEGEAATGSDRPRRMRDAVEAALADIILLGTEEHVRLAERAARELVAGKHVQTHELVVSLRNFIRKALDLDPVPADLDIPLQGPARPSASSAGRGKSADGGDSNRSSGGNRQAGGSGGLALGMGGLMGMGAGSSLDPDTPDNDPADPASHR